MSFQQRVLLAVALCAAIWVVFDLSVPKPEPLPPAEVTATADDGADTADITAKTPAEAESQAEPPVAAPVIPEVERQLRNQYLSLTVSNRSPADGGLIAGMELLAPQFVGETTATDAMHLAGERTLEISFADEASDVRIPRGTAFELQDEGPRHVTLVHRGANEEVTERIELLEGYEARLLVSITNRADRPRDHRLHLTTRVGVAESRYDASRGLCRTAEDLEEEDASDVEDGPIAYGGKISWGGVDTKYFGQFVVPTTAASNCEIRDFQTGKFVETRLSEEVAQLGPGERRDYEFRLFIGPKELERLQDFSAHGGEDLDVDAAISWGIFGGVSEGLGRLLLAMLRWFYGLTASWGAAIVLLTVVAKAVTLPLTLKQMNSMKHMRAIQPEMAKIKEKYKDDRVKQHQEMQALFARSGVNPLAGCLPTLVQLPVWFALYSMLSAAVELVHQEFLWLPDLTEQDPYYVLPLALGAMMVVQSRLTPNSSMDETQAKMMKWMMPAMFTAFMLFIPSGLGVYIFANTFLSVVQTAIQLGVGKEPKAKPA